MNVLLVGLDNSVLSESVASDTRERHLQYAATLAERRPGSHLYMIVHSDAAEGLEPQQLSDNLTIYPTNSRHRYLFFFDILRIGRRLCHQHGIDLVTTQTPFDDGLAGYLLANRYRGQYLAQLRPSNLDDPYWLEERRLNRLLRVVGRWLVPRADAVRVVSEASKQWCASELGIDPDRLYLNHIAMSMLDHDAPSDVERDPQSVLYVGRLSEEKGLPYLLQAFERVLDSVPDATLTIVGDGPERSELEALAEKLDISSSVSFEGSVAYEAVPRYYRQAGILALPSLHENFGRVILEAFSFGTPAVVSDAEGPSELVTDGETGFIVPKADADALAARLQELLDDIDRQRSFGENVREFVKAEFDPEQLVTEIVSTWIAVGTNESIPQKTPPI